MSTPSRPAASSSRQTPVILAIDEGTTNAKAIAVDTAGQILAKASVPLALEHPQPGWAEQDPQAIELAQLIDDKGPQAALAQISGLDANSDVVAEAVNAYNATK